MRPRNTNGDTDGDQLAERRWRDAVAADTGPPRVVEKPDRANPRWTNRHRSPRAVIDEHRLCRPRRPTELRLRDPRVRRPQHLRRRLRHHPRHPHGSGSAQRRLRHGDRTAVRPGGHPTRDLRGPRRHGRRRLADSRSPPAHARQSRRVACLKDRRLHDQPRRLR